MGICDGRDVRAIIIRIGFLWVPYYTCRLIVQYTPKNPILTIKAATLFGSRGSRVWGEAQAFGGRDSGGTTLGLWSCNLFARLGLKFGNMPRGRESPL